MKRLTQACLIAFILLSPFVGAVMAASVEDLAHFPKIFGQDFNNLTYFHSHSATPEELEASRSISPIFEIDLAWAQEQFHPSIVGSTPYIGHPKEFYTEMGNSFPSRNVKLEEFQLFMKNNPSLKVLIDVKDERVFPYLSELIKTVGAKRCIVHAFIKGWTLIPKNIEEEPHWYREDVDLSKLDPILVKHGVPLIANCRGFSDEHVEKKKLLARMLKDSRKYKSVVSLGFYYPEAPLPNVELLKAINQNGFFAWVNGNVPNFLEKVGSLKYIAMSDDLAACTSFSENIKATR